MPLELHAFATIRPGTLADAPAIARIHVETWRFAYRNLISSAFLDALSIERRTLSWEKTLHEKTHSLLVAEVAGTVVGWVSFGLCRDEGEAHQAEIYAIYLDVAHQRAGLGRALMAEAERSLARLLPKASRVSLGVLGRNESARHFYKRCGDETNSREKTVLIGDGQFIEVRYEKSTTGSRPTDSQRRRGWSPRFSRR